ncbi:hypothetical protein QQP08_019677 [Theobroma cacao]|nr:hypothetical protein QQP08_019677 [Theobroma cacao]
MYHHTQRSLPLPIRKTDPFTLNMIVLVTICFLLREKMTCACIQQKDRKSVISGTLISFSYSELSFATAKFAKRLGGGGFGVA